MKKKYLLLSLGLFLLNGFPMLGQSMEDRKLPYFDQLKVYGPFRVYLEKGERESISISAYGWREDEIITEVKNDRLKIKLKDEFGVLKNKDKDQDHRRRVRVFLTYTELRVIDAVAGADLLSKSTIESGTLELSVAKGAVCDLDIEVNKLDVSVTTGGVAHLEGVAKIQEATVQTGSQLDAFYLESNDVYIKAHTGGTAEVRANKSIEARAGTGGSITYRGRPEIRDINTSLGGSVSSRY